MSALGDKIRELRSERRMTLRQLGRDIGLPARVMSDIEHGRSAEVAYAALPAIARALGVSDVVLEAAMVTTAPEDLEARVAKLEREIGVLTERVAALVRLKQAGEWRA